MYIYIYVYILNKEGTTHHYNAVWCCFKLKERSMGEKTTKLRNKIPSKVYKST